MREIKFRCYHKGAKQMLYGENASTFRWIEHEHQPVELMQYTGLKDRNGKEIYEGDICKGHTQIDEDLIIDEVGVVEFFNYSWICKGNGEYDSSMIGWYESIEVIGNIYENPELLTK